MEEQEADEPSAKVYLNEERRFLPEELFFSRSDPRGVVTGGNGVFVRVSGYSWEELMGAPHKTVRHEDMPRAVFWLIWRSIKAGQPIGAYVKNRAKDGRYYWVFAIVIAEGEGFVSVRLKPTSPMLDTVKALYARIRAAELAEDIEPEQSAQALLAELAELGFPDYGSFMSYALSQEIRSRDAHLRRGANSQMERFAETLTQLDTIRKEGRAIVTGFKAIEGSPKNMRIHATRMGERAAPLGVISTNFDDISNNIKSGIRPFLDGLDHMADRLCAGLFVNCAFSMLSEIIVQFAEEPDHDIATVTRAEMARLVAERPQRRAEGKNVLHEVLKEMACFEAACRMLKRTLSGLNIMRVMSEIETARIGDPTGSMSEIILRLQRFQSLTHSSLQAIEARNGQIQSLLRNEIYTREAA
ncbi:PAS domain-containing protein [Gymnodinialimonas ceratoperidinii]|uniref:PAS domain-containing protein n=1 Tax=Gymnodinialimonas ceratoperidinii TaxID=2856823 RepID=A0A8F6TV22_9RHOB|nr:PAS domain-containing protein [Gymnodinialimonas ceratoperidinii]QXT38403.1 PAS domain-containing protein [Gymnodinialimonas ceratoperidinii]